MFFNCLNFNPILMCNCGICFEQSEAPHFLPCTHTFCYFCIGRHMRENSFCPICFVVFSKFELTTKCAKIHVLDIPSPLLVNKEPAMKVILKKYTISFEGDSRSLSSDKFMDLVDILHKEQFMNKMLSTSEIAWTVNSSRKPRKRIQVHNKRVIASLIELRKRI